MLFYNLILTTLNESYLMIALCCMIGLNKLHFNFHNYGETIQSAFCILALLVLIGYPVLVFWILKKNWKDKDFDEIQKRFQPIFESLRTQIGPIALIDPMYFLFRRFILAMMVVFLKEHLIFQVIVKNFSIIGGTIIAGYIQYSDRTKRITEFVNETLLMCMLYCVICFSPFVPDVGARQLFGYFMCSLVSIHFLSNLYFITGSTV